MMLMICSQVDVAPPGSVAVKVLMITPTPHISTSSTAVDETVTSQLSTANPSRPTHCNPGLPGSLKHICSRSASDNTTEPKTARFSRVYGNSQLMVISSGQIICGGNLSCTSVWTIQSLK